MFIIVCVCHFRSVSTDQTYICVINDHIAGESTATGALAIDAVAGVATVWFTGILVSQLFAVTAKIIHGGLTHWRLLF